MKTLWSQIVRKARRTVVPGMPAPHVELAQAPAGQPPEEDYHGDSHKYNEKANFADMDPEFRSIYAQCSPYTMTSTERMYAMYKATEYIVKQRVPGEFVECGVWRGGSIMVAALALKQFGCTHRKIYLYDTFEGLPKPDENLSSTGYPRENIVFVKGMVEQTIPATVPERIAMLRLDTDWYSSTRHELLHLWPKMEQHGVLIIDDYGHWMGAKKAVDEYFHQTRTPVLLNRIDYSGRLGIKVG
jgi:hypothetical protein